MVIGIREFKNRATELVRLVEAGKEEVTITRHAKPVARLVRTKKVKPASADSEREALAHLAALGLVRLGDGKPFSKTWRPIKGRGRPGSEIIIEEREDRF